MTCVVAYVDKDDVGYMAADSAGTDIGQHSRCFLETRKIFKVGDTLFGYTSSFRMGQIIENCFEFPERKENISDYKYIVSQVVPELRNTYVKENYMLETEKQAGTFLMIFNGKIYEIQDAFSVLCYSQNYNSVGSGGAQAKSSIATMIEFGLFQKYSVEDLLQKTIEIVSKDNITVSGRIDVMSTKV